MKAGRWLSAVAVAAGALLFLAQPAPAVDYAVNDFADAPDADPDDGECRSTLGTCTLRAAVMQSQHDTRIPATIVLRAGTYRLTIPEPSPTRGEAGNLRIFFGNVTIRGAGAELTTIEQTADGRILAITAGNVILQGLTLTGGNVTGDPFGGGAISSGAELTLRDVTLSGNSTDTFGGGLSTLGPLHMVDSLVEGNRAATGGGIGALGTVDITSSRITDNTAFDSDSSPIAGTGGGIAWETGFPGRHVSFRLSGSKVDHNRAEGHSTEELLEFPGGGGVFMFGAPCCTQVDSALIVDTKITDNRAADFGGGLYTYGFQELNVERSLLAGNHALRGGGANIESPVDFLNSTVSGNSSDRQGGAFALRDPRACFTGPIHCARSSLRLRYTTLAGNTAGSGESGIASENPNLANILQLLATILDNDPASNCPEPRAQFVDDIGSNIETGTSCDFTAATSLSSTDPLLAPLADNGGPTQTHALTPGSPAVDAARGGCPRYDQRFAFRPAGVRCDIGAYEANARFFVLPTTVLGRGGLLVVFAPSALSKAGVTLGATQPAEIGQDGLSFTEPLGESRLGERRAQVDGVGALLLLGPNVTAELGDWRLRLEGDRGTVHARLGKQDVPLLELTDATVAYEGWDASAKAHATLTAEGAKALNNALGTVAFAKGTAVGTVQFAIDLKTDTPPPPTDNPTG